MAPVRKILDALSESLWFVPAIWVVLCAAAAFAIVAVDRLVAPELGREVPLVFSGGPEGARGLLSAIASSMITVVGVVFSITIVALQLASAQYSPRVLRNFMRDRASQMTLGTLIGTFVYSLLILRVVRTADDARDEFVPFLGVTGAVVLAIGAVAMLVFFIHHIATRMQVSHITAAVAKETLEEIHRQSAAREEAEDLQSKSHRPVTAARHVKASRSGYLQYVQIDALRDLAQREDVVVALEVAPGGWVQKHTALFRVWGSDASAEFDDQLRQQVSVGDERVVYQDPEFGIQQLVDIAVKALSPGINDPTTARNALHRLVEVVVAVARSDLAAQRHYGTDGVLRLEVARPAFSDLIRTAFEEIHHFGSDIPSVRRALSQSFELIESAVDDTHKAVVAGLRRDLAQGGVADGVRP